MLDHLATFLISLLASFAGAFFGSALFAAGMFREINRRYGGFLLAVSEFHPSRTQRRSP